LPIAQALTQLPVGGVTAESVSMGQANSAVRIIVKLDAKRPTQVPGFEQAKVVIRQQLAAAAAEKAAAQFSADILKDAKVQE
jgi:parvulin-like peptidyl-prolyl isomerase